VILVLFPAVSPWINVEDALVRRRKAMLLAAFPALSIAITMTWLVALVGVIEAENTLAKVVPVTVAASVLVACTICRTLPELPEGAAQVPSARRKLLVPPPDSGANPAAVEVTRGRVTSVPVLDSSKRVAAV
jgi:LSD1 subclass zinc finger protein